MLSLLKFPQTIFINNKDIILQVHRRRGAKNLRLRYDIATDIIHMSLPYRVSVAEALEFLHKNTDWLAKQTQNRQVIPYHAGVMIPYCGEMRLLCHDENCKTDRVDDECIIIGGGESKFAMRVEKLLKKQVRLLLTDLVEEYTSSVGCDYTKIRIGDAKGSWGSCSSIGTLSFSWRLIFLREALMRYVVVHEVCHLRHMNHSADFWGLVGEYISDYKNLRKELRLVGGELRLIGAD